MKNAVEYDLSPAVQAMRVLRFESHNYQDCHDLVWEPTQALLDELARAKPESITCLHGLPYKTKRMKGFASNVYIVGSDNKVFYLCTVVDCVRAQSNYLWFLDTFKKFPDKVQDLKKKGPMAIIRWWIMCSVPVDCIGLTPGEIQTGVRKYLSEFCPELSNISIECPSIDSQKTTDAEIVRKAQATAKPQTPKERANIFLSDLEQ